MDRPAIDYYGFQPSPLRLGPDWRATCTVTRSPPLLMSEPALFREAVAPFAASGGGWFAWLRGIIHL